MSEPLEQVELVGLPVGPRGRPVLAWIVILAVVGVVVWYQNDAARERPAGKGTGGTEGLNLMARLLVAIKHMAGKADPHLGDELDAFDTETFGDRLRLAILAGELQGAEQARQRLAGLSAELGNLAAAGAAVGGAARLVARPSDIILTEILTRLYDDYLDEEFTAPTVTDAERDVLRKELGWFGDLALAPADGPDAQARQAMIQVAYRPLLVGSGLLCVYGVAGMVGLVGLIGFLIRLGAGTLPCEFRPGSPHGGVYAETFAVWLLLFVGSSFGAALLPLPRVGLLLPLATFLFTLTALAWPVLRGIPWRVVREDVGLTAGRSPVLEPLLGVAAYAGALPLALLGLIVMFMLLRTPLGQSAPHPTHPAFEVLPHLGAWGKVQMILLACVAAPLVEETMFRGVLYRHLRELSERLGRAASVLASALLVSFLFALVHPQGFLGVPPLMGLAMAFTFAREWRGTLVPAMVAHGVTNGLSLLAVLLLLGD